MIYPAAPGSQVCLANQDLVNPVYVARKPNFTLGSPAALAIPPLGSITVNGSKTLWGLATAGTASLLVMPGGGQWAPSPAQVAAQIQALGLATFAEQVAQNTAIPTNIFGTGVPLYTKSQVVLNTTQSLAPGGSYSSGNLAFGQIGFELRVNAKYTSGVPNNGFYQIQLNWFDSNTGLLVDQDEYVSICATAGDTTGFTTNVKGPSKADICSLSIKSYEGGGGATMSAGIVLLANSRFYGSDQIFTPNWASTSGVAAAIGNRKSKIENRK